MNTNSRKIGIICFIFMCRSLLIVESAKPSCRVPWHWFTSWHHKDIGFVRDVICELFRKMIKCLEAYDDWDAILNSCDQLAIIKTSGDGIPFFRKFQVVTGKDAGKNDPNVVLRKEIHKKITEAALRLLDLFTQSLNAKYYDLKQQQEICRGFVEKAKNLLLTSKLYDGNSDIIQYLEKIDHRLRTMSSAEVESVEVGTRNENPRKP